MGKKKIYDKEFYEKMESLAREGKNSKEIAEILLCCRKRIQRYLKTKGLNYTALYKPKSLNSCLQCNELCEGKFCCRSCSAIYNNNERHKNRTPKQLKVLENKKFFTEMFKDYKGGERLKKIAEYNLLQLDFDDIESFERKRKRIILEQEGKCNKCGIDSWLGSPIAIEIDHIDGNNKNNNRENLEGICPNCHSTTDTWRGRNRKDKSDKIKLTPEDFKDAYINNKENIRQALLSLGIAAKGGNYKSMYAALDLFDIEYMKQSKKKNMLS